MYDYENVRSEFEQMNCRDLLADDPTIKLEIKGDKVTVTLILDHIHILWYEC